MSAPAPALSTAVPAVESKRPFLVVIRLADSSAVAAYVSFAFALAMAFFPVSFPALIAQNWLNGRLVPVLALGTCLLNAISYLRGSHMLSRKPGLIASAVLACFTVLTVVGFSVIETTVVTPWLAGLANPQAYAIEVLAHTYFTMIAALFIPFLAVRFLQGIRLSQPDHAQ